ncbi:regulator of mushroom development [Schizophyllum commune Tattone D]|nr:regulator of mushroom development [Schizophyllum commune Tattone D]
MYDSSYASTYSDSSLPRTPSPINPAAVQLPMKGALDVQEPLHYHDQSINHGLFNVVDNPHAMLPVDDNAVPSESYRPSWQNPPRGSLMQELYDGESAAHARSGMHYMGPPPMQHGGWNHHLPPAHGLQEQHHMMRRATFPYVRHDHPQNLYMQQAHMMHPPHDMYMDGGVPQDVDVYAHSHSQIKLEDEQRPMPRHMINGYPYPHPQYPYPDMGPMYHMHVQHTDDAASKETQYLRRRCFNCHTTEPPSWRRSTLNPGKIVCNKCGLYERTHLRPRPLRFDELRAGSKTRKGGRNGNGKSPKTAKAVVKKESREDLEAAGMLTRRSSQSSLGASSDLDESLALNSPTPPSSGSNPGSNYNSPHLPSYPLSSATSSSRDSHSPPALIEGGIRLPNASLTDLGGGLMMSPPTSRTADHSSPLLSAPSHDSRYRSSSLSQQMGPAVDYGKGA